ncbi:MAG: class I SAM-dependent methyltransferase [bacterium]
MQSHDLERIFTHCYDTNSWGDQESVSGSGSTVKYTQNIRRVLPNLIHKLRVKSILDAPCGDYNWFKLIKWKTPITYLGGDIVATLIENNQRLYHNKDTQFIQLDIVHDKLPSADLWLCRDCLFHLSNRDIMQTLDHFLNSHIKYLLTSTHPNCLKNTDIVTGSFRELNLRLPPYNFSEPITTINDWIKGYPVRQLALWDRTTLKISA